MDCENLGRIKEKKKTHPLAMSLNIILLSLSMHFRMDRNIFVLFPIFGLFEFVCCTLQEVL